MHTRPSFSIKQLGILIATMNNKILNLFQISCLALLLAAVGFWMYGNTVATSGLQSTASRARRVPPHSSFTLAGRRYPLLPCGRKDLPNLASVSSIQETPGSCPRLCRSASAHTTPRRGRRPFVTITSSIRNKCVELRCTVSDLAQQRTHPAC